MKKSIRHFGFDVDSATIAVAVAEPGGEVRSLGAIPYSEEAVRKLVKKLGPAAGMRVCYEAGPHGYRLYWLLAKLGVHCDVVAPTLVPVRAGDRVKTNRRDAEKLASRFRRLSAKGKLRQKIVTAIARELLGFVWAIGIQVEKETQHPKQRHGRAA